MEGRGPRLMATGAGDCEGRRTLVNEGQTRVLMGPLAVSAGWSESRKGGTDNGRWRFAVSTRLRTGA